MLYTPSYKRLVNSEIARPPEEKLWFVRLETFAISGRTRLPNRGGHGRRSSCPTHNPSSGHWS